jgi:hypothetical protein
MAFRWASLEERTLFRILEFRNKELEDNVIAEEIGISQSTLEKFEEETKKAITDAYDKGYTDLESICSFISASGVHEDDFYGIIGEYRVLAKLAISYYNPKFLNQMKLRKHSIDRVIEDISALVDLGVPSIERISEITGETTGDIINYSTIYEIKLPENGKPVKQFDNKKHSIADVKKAIRWGANSVERISKVTGLSHHYLTYELLPKLRKQGVRLPKSSRIKHNLKWDKLIRKGFSFSQIGSKYGKDRRTIWEYASRTRQLTKWREVYNPAFKAKRKGYQEAKRQATAKLAGVIKTIYESRLKDDEKWAYEKTLEYYRKTSETNFRYCLRIPITTVFTIYKRYDEAKIKGEKKSLEELGEGLHMRAMGVSRILKVVGLDTLYASRERMSKEQKDALYNGRLIKMPIPVIAHLVGVSSATADLYIKKYLEEGEKRLTIRGCLFMSDKASKKLTYTLASEIYEAQDSGSSDRKIIGSLGIDRKVLDYAIQHKDTIGGEIIGTLKTMFPHRSITKPYRDFKI